MVGLHFLHVGALITELPLLDGVFPPRRLKVGNEQFSFLCVKSVAWRQLA